MLYEKIMSDIKQAMLNKDITRKEVLKQVKMKTDAIIKEAKKTGQVVEDSTVVTAINKELKQLNQTFEAIKERTDTPLYKSTVEKINILKGYLPKSLTEDEIRAEISKIIDGAQETGGKLLGTVMKALKGKADNTMIRKIFEDMTR